VSSPNINEGGGAFFTVSAPTILSQPVVVNYTMSGTAVMGTHYTLSGTPGQVTIPAGASSANIVIAASISGLKTGSETATMGLDGGDAATVTITNVKVKKPKASTISVSVLQPSINEGAAAIFRISSSNVNWTAPTVVNYVMSGTALPASTYYTLSSPGGTANQAVIPQGASSVDVTLNSAITGLSSGSVTAVMMVGPGNYKAPKTTKKGPKPTVTIVNVITDLLAGSTEFTGPYPDPTTVTYTDNGQSKGVFAYPGEIMVIFNTPISDSDAKTLINANGGSVLREIPTVGYYLVQVAIGSEGPFIQAIKADSRVKRALPTPVGIRGSAPGAVTMEGCGDNHAVRVAATIITNGGTLGNCIKIDDTNSQIDSDKIVKEILGLGDLDKTGTTLINLSSYGTHEGANGINFNNQPSTVQRQLEDEWYNFMSVVLDAIGKLPLEYRAHLVITICSGNNNMEITDLMTELKQDSIYADVLHNNVLVVSTDLMAGNFSDSDPDVAVSDNPEAVGGTSFAAPGALAVIQQIMNQTGASAEVALQAAKAAVAANPNHRLLLSEAVLTLTITKAGTGTGTVTSTTTVATPNEPGPKYTIGAVVKLTAVPDTGSTFDGWSGNASGTGTATVTMDANKAVTATFNLPAGSPSLVITSQTWTPQFFNGQIVSYNAVITGTASGPVGSALDAVSFDFGGVGAFTTSSWGPSTIPGDFNQNERRPSDPATTTWTVTESFAGTDEVITISLGVPFVGEINVHAHP